MNKLRTLALLGSCALFAAPAPTQAPSRDELTAAMAAKVLASGVFVSERDAEDVLNANVHRMISLFGYGPTDITDYVVDRERGIVTVRIKDAPARAARFYGDQGCVVLPSGVDDVSFEPIDLRSDPRDIEEQPWPSGQKVEPAPLPFNAPVDRPPEDSFPLGAQFLRKLSILLLDGDLDVERHEMESAADRVVHAS